VIVGAGLAGAKAAETLRLDGFQGRIVLIGADSLRPYSRPPLSKGYLRGERERTSVFIHEASFYSEHDIELMVATRVTDLIPGTAVIRTDSDGPIKYDRLLLATGARPRTLDVPGSDLDGIHYLRTLGDADRLRYALKSTRRLAVIGGGWIGSEVAASARQMGVDVVLIDPKAYPLQTVLGPEVGKVFRDLHVEHGVELKLGTRIASFVGDGPVEGVRTTAGEIIEADLVLVGIGVKPRTELAAAADLTLDNGIAVDQHLETGLPGIFAAGDVASAWHPSLNRRLRVEHWGTARDQGIIAGKNMLGAVQVYDRIPNFFSDQYDFGIEYVGHADHWDRVVFRGDPTTRSFITFWLADGRVVAAMSANVSDVKDSFEALIRSKGVISVARLVDPDVPLDELLDDGSSQLLLENFMEQREVEGRRYDQAATAAR
jgi:3-phenylpropionate/trans-cinnamate dioxygenase ferredoxin reductase subunit